LFTRNGRALTAKGIKPVCPYQHKFEYSYLFGAFSVINGSHFLLELPFCNTHTFQLFLDEFSLQNPTELKLMVLDNGAFHKSKGLVVPKNIILIFLPPYSPELNPAEKVWWVMKRELVNKTFITMEQLQDQITVILRQKINVDAIKTLCSYQYYSCSF
jgi:transposase